VRRAVLGISGQRTPIPRRIVRALGLPREFGVLIAGIDGSGPAAMAGLKTGDIVVKLDDQPVSGVDDLLRRLTDERVDRALKVTALRGIELKDFYAVAVERRVA
jgi:S1-C subfamily serine protease